MALVRIDFHGSGAANFASSAALVVCETMQRLLNVPSRENFLISAPHPSEHFMYEPDSGDTARAERIVFIQITLNEGRSAEVKQEFLATLTADLHEAVGISPRDVFINLVEVKRENWSFGQGRTDSKR